MARIDFTQTKLNKIIVHIVGNSFRQEKIKFSETFIDVKEKDKDIILKHFLSPIHKQKGTYRFFDYTSLAFNAVFSELSLIFNNFLNIKENQNSDLNTHKIRFLIQSITEKLYQASKHTRVQKGKFYVVYLNDVIIDDEMVDAIGLFKTEHEDKFIQIDDKDLFQFDIKILSGQNLNSNIEKGALIYNTEKTNGYVVSIYDSINDKNAQYWQNDFLQIKPREDAYSDTKEYISGIKDFIKSTDIQINEKTKLLEDTENYFKTNLNSKFDADDFSAILDPEIAEMLKEHLINYSNEKDVNVSNSFDISEEAVKDSKKYFKSVLKLDKNFHLYIHGGHNLIEKGYDAEKKMDFYKLYFTKEV